MASLNRAKNRDRKRDKEINGHQEDGRSVFTIQEQQKKRAEKLRREREEKQRRQEEI